MTVKQSETPYNIELYTSTSDLIAELARKKVAMPWAWTCDTLVLGAMVKEGVIDVVPCLGNTGNRYWCLLFMGRLIMPTEHVRFVGDKE